MRLYGYVATKEELLDLMVDAVYAEMELPSSVAGTGAGLFAPSRTASRGRLRSTGGSSICWAGGLHLGQNALAYQEASLAALSSAPGFEAIDFVMQAIVTVNSYVLARVG